MCHIVKCSGLYLLFQFNTFSFYQLPFFHFMKLSVAYTWLPFHRNGQRTRAGPISILQEKFGGVSRIRKNKKASLLSLFHVIAAVKDNRFLHSHRENTLKNKARREQLRAKKRRKTIVSELEAQGILEVLDCEPMNFLLKLSSVFLFLLFATNAP